MTEMIPLYDVPFVPAYDPNLSLQDENKSGVLCVLYHPAVGVNTVRVQRNLVDIMKTLGCVFNNTGSLEFYKLGKKLLITQTEANIRFPGVLKYNGELFDTDAAVLICNENFTSLRESDALIILESAKLHREKNNSYYVTIEIRDDINE